MAGVGGGVVIAMFALLVVGPAYCRSAVTPGKHGLVPSGRGLARDADEALTIAAASYLHLRSSRVIRWA